MVQLKVSKRGSPLTGGFELLDFLILFFLVFFAGVIVLPFISVIATSFSTQREYMLTPILLFPREPTLFNYEKLFADGRIWTGYRTTFTFLILAVPLNMFLTTSVAYGLSKTGFPGKKFFTYAIVFTMLFNGGIVPMYLLMRDLNLINSAWSVVLASGINTFFMIIMRTNIAAIPESLIESAKLDGASEWRILAQMILPLSMPIIATLILFYSVDRWNEWYNPMIFIRKPDLQALQLVLRSIVIDSRITDTMSVSVANVEISFIDGMKMACVMVTMLPVMCVFPFLQRYFVKGMLIGAIKA